MPIPDFLLLPMQNTWLLPLQMDTRFPHSRAPGSSSAIHR
jgi:hypothetical protein